MSFQKVTCMWLADNPILKCVLLEKATLYLCSKNLVQEGGKKPPRNLGFKFFFSKVSP